MKLLKELLEDVKFEDVKVDGKRIGSVWYEDGEWHSEYEGTGMTWATDNKKDAISVVVDNHEQG